MTCGIDSGCSGNCNQSRNCPSRNVAHSTAGNIAISGVIVAFFVVVLAWAGPGIDDNGIEFAHADEAIAQQQQAARFDAAAREMCGENAAWIKLDEGTIQCLTHRGAKTIVAKVKP